MNQDRQRRLLAKKEMKKTVSKFEEIDLKKAIIKANEIYNEKNTD